MCGRDYVKKFQRAKGREGVLTTFTNLDSLLGLKPVLVPLKFLGRFTPMESSTTLTASVAPERKSFSTVQLVFVTLSIRLHEFERTVFIVSSCRTQHQVYTTLN